VTRLLPHRDGWCGEIRFGEVADGNGDVSRKAFALPVDGGAACQAGYPLYQAQSKACPLHQLLPLYRQLTLM